MIVFLNGNFVPEEQAVISVFDRGFLYGDGLFETMLVHHSRPFRWAQHLERLRHGAELLRLRLPFSVEDLRREADELIRRNRMPTAFLRLTLSRGVGLRGYSIEQAHQPSLVMSLHPTAPVDPSQPPRWRLVTSSIRMPARDPLATIKTCSKLPQILARTEAEEAGADEALLLNTDGQVAEAASSNLFWIENGTVCTTPLEAGVLAGVTRAVVRELCPSRNVPGREKSVLPEELRHAEGVFLTMSTLGIVEVVRLDGDELPVSPLVATIRAAYWRRVEEETHVSQP